MKDFAALKKEIVKDAESRRAFARKKNELLDQVRLGALREAREVTQKELAKSMKTTQSAISRLENQTDLYLTTLRGYVEALGGQLEINAVFGDTRVEIETFGRLSGSRRAKPSRRKTTTRKEATAR